MVVKLFYDKDDGDVDDFSDAARIAIEAKHGNFELYFVGVDVSEAKSPGSLDALFKAIDHQPTLPIASWQNDVFTQGPGPNSWIDYIYDNFDHDVLLSDSCPEYVVAARQALHDANDASITMLFTGTMHAGDALLNSSSDGIDSRNGSDLIADKVLAVHWVAGRGDGSGSANDPNITADLSAALDFIANCPVPIYWCVIGIGDDKKIGVSEWGGLLASDNILRTAYDTSEVGSIGREGWSQPTPDVFSGRGGWGFEAGTMTVDGSGNSTWTPGAGPHFLYVQTEPAKVLVEAWDDIITRFGSTMPREGDVLQRQVHQLFGVQYRTLDALRLTSGHQEFSAPTTPDMDSKLIVYRSGHQMLHGPEDSAAEYAALGTLEGLWLPRERGTITESVQDLTTVFQADVIADLSGHGHDLARETANSWNDAAVRTNGYPAIGVAGGRFKVTGITTADTPLGTWFFTYYRRAGSFGGESSYARLLSLFNSGPDYDGNDRIAAILRNASTDNFLGWYNSVAMELSALPVPDEQVNIIISRRSDGGDTFSFWVNGVKGTDQTGLGTAHFAITGIGVGDHGDSAEGPTGGIGDFGWYSEALTDGEVDDLYALIASYMLP